jgi:putative endonuclease
MFARDKGQQIEQQVSRYLQKQGLRLIEQNYHCRGGEIDLIMKEKDTLVFVEVRFRKSARFGSALESVNRQKQAKIILTAQHYIQTTAPSADQFRFDVVAVKPTEASFQIEWVKNAFQLN